MEQANALTVSVAEKEEALCKQKKELNVQAGRMDQTLKKKCKNAVVAERARAETAFAAERAGWQAEREEVGASVPAPAQHRLQEQLERSVCNSSLIAFSPPATHQAARDKT